MNISENQLSRFVSDERRLIVELLARGILNPSWRCSLGRKHFPSVVSRRFRCLCERRDRTKTIFYKSFFENMSLGVGQIFRLAYDWLGNSPAKVTAVRRSVSPKTVYCYARYFRQLVSAALRESPVRVGGIGVCVEVDEMFVKKNSDGSEVWVIGALDRARHSSFACSVLRSKSPSDIVAAIGESIRARSLLVTDALPSYSLVAQTLALPHTRVNKARGILDRSTRMHTNSIESMWHHLRQFLALRRQVPIDSAIDEFVWRRQNRDNLWDGFLTALAKVDWK